MRFRIAILPLIALLALSSGLASAQTRPATPADYKSCASPCAHLEDNAASRSPSGYQQFLDRVTTPEPSSIALVGGGLVLAAAFTRRKKKAK